MLTTFTLPETMLCTERYLRYCRALPCTALCSAATIPLKCLHFVAFNSYVRTLILIINFAQTRWPTVNSIFCTRELLHGKWSMTDCHFQYWLHVWVWGCITHRCLSSLSLFCFQGVDTIRFQNRFPPDQWEDALAFFTASTEQGQWMHLRHGAPPLVR